MNCQDVAKLRTPLDAVCQTTDIGCVPIVDGKPTCSPQPDELPFAFDPKTTTLWIFSCKTREWINFTKFTMCQLDALNLDNITNICDILNIGVNYAGSGECKQGTITLAELVERIKECLTLETKIITIGEGDGNKVKISIDGLPNLPPVYVQGENIWSEGGSGTETDPLIVATYDPICKWPVKSQKQVDDANVKHLGACLDGEMSRVPFPPKVCELPEISQEQVDASNDKKVIACVDGNGVKAPFPLEPCKYPQMTAEQVKNASDKDLIVCVDGQNGKVPVPDSLFDTSLCEYPLITLDEAKGLGTNLTIGACASGREVRIPVYGSGFFDRDYICVPLTDGPPSGAPFSGTGPLRVDCNGTLWVWLCDQSKWQRVTDGIGGVPGLNPANIPDICNNLRFKGWFSNNADPCVQDVQFTLQQLAAMILDCAPNISNCNELFTETYERCTPKRSGANRDFDLYYGTTADPSGVGADGLHSYKFLVYSSLSDSFVVGSGKSGPNQQAGDNETGVNMITRTNTSRCVKTYTFDLSVQLFCTSVSFTKRNMPSDLTVTAVAALTDQPVGTYDYIMGTGSGGEGWGFSPRNAKASLNAATNMVDGFYLGQNETDMSKMRGSTAIFGRAPREQKITLYPGQSFTKYLHGMIIFATTAGSIGSDDGESNSFNFGCYCNVREYRGVLI